MYAGRHDESSAGAAVVITEADVEAIVREAIGQSEARTVQAITEVIRLNTTKIVADAPQLRFSYATVARQEDGFAALTPDGQTEQVPATTLGLHNPGDRVAVMHYPPSGAIVIGGLSSASPGGGTGTPSDVYVGSCHFGKSQCFMDLDTSTAANTQWNDLNIPSSEQDRVNLMPLADVSSAHYYAKLRCRLAVSVSGVAYMHAAIGQFAQAQTTAPGTNVARSIVAGSELSSTDPSGSFYVTQETPWLDLDLFAAQPTWGGFITLFTWTDDPYQGFFLGGEITVVRRP